MSARDTLVISKTILPVFLQVFAKTSLVFDFKWQNNWIFARERNAHLLCNTRKHNFWAGTILNNI